MIYLTLFGEFFLIGLFAIGGGMATVPFLIDLTTRYDWYTASEFTNMVAVSQSTPGPVGINMATYAGYEAAGIPGALIATLGLITPALFIMMLIAKFMQNFSERKLVKHIFTGIRPVVAALILYAAWELCGLTLFTSTTTQSFVPLYDNLLLCVLLFACMQYKKLAKVHPLIWILIGAVVGIVFSL